MLHDTFLFSFIVVRWQNTSERSTRLSEKQGFSPILARLPKSAKLLEKEVEIWHSEENPLSRGLGRPNSCARSLEESRDPFSQHEYPCFEQNPRNELFFVNSRVSSLNHGSPLSWEAGFVVIRSLFCDKTEKTP